MEREREKKEKRRERKEEKKRDRIRPQQQPPPRDGREALSVCVVLSCHGMLCWLPAGPGCCSVAGRDQTGTQSLSPSLFQIQIPLPTAPFALCNCYVRFRTHLKNSRAPIFTAFYFCYFDLHFLLLPNWNSRLPSLFLAYWHLIIGRRR